MRHFSWFMGLVLVLGLAACSTSSPSGGDAQMADCCKTTADLKAQMPKCCATAGAECCAKKSDCCKKAEELSAKLPACCKKQAAGEAQACCTKK